MTRTWMIHWTAAALVVPLFMSCGGPSKQQAEDEPLSVTFATPGGTELRASLLVPKPDGGAPSGLLLLHRAGSDRRGWELFARRLRREGRMVMTIDFPGHGESAPRPDLPQKANDFSRADWLALLDDCGAALDKLVAEGADASNLAVGGEGVGANLALHLARRAPRVRALVLVSPGLTQDGVEAAPMLEELTDCPVLYLAAEGDNYAAESARTLAEQTPGFHDLKIFPGTHHGTDLFAGSPSAMNQTIKWLETVLGTR